MKYTPLLQKMAQPASHVPDQITLVGSQGIALSPPTYGVDLIDHQPAQASSELAPGGQAREGAAGPAQVGAIQRQMATPGAANRASTINPQNKSGLPDHLKAGLEALSGFTMDDVNVHYNSAKPAQVQALAYTQGAEIHLGPGQERHLPHEAWHVVQQKQGRVRPTGQVQDLALTTPTWSARPA
jgi:hypothetical protein